MKKFLFAAAVSAALAGCVSNEAEITPNADSPITFAAPLVSSITRSATGEIANPYPDTEHFVVFAKLYDDNGYTDWASGQWYIGDANGGVEVEYDATLSGWAPNGKSYYWPKNGSLTFYAYSPADYTTWKPAIANEQMTASGVVIPTTDHNVDLMYSKLAKDKKANDDKTGNNGTTAEYKGVELIFKHALSSIQFKVKTLAEYADATIVLNKIELTNVNTTGDFVLENIDSDSTPEWTSTTIPANYVAVESANQTVASTTATAVDNTTGDNAMILLPQALTDVVAKVTYTLNGFEFTTEIKLGTLSYTGQDTAEWIAGKRYIYTIIFSLDKIYFDPSVSNWEDVNVTYQENGNA